MHGERAERHVGREYWSRRLGESYTWGRLGKWLTHRRERAAAKRLEQRMKRNPEAWELER